MKAIEPRPISPQESAVVRKALLVGRIKGVPVIEDLIGQCVQSRKRADPEFRVRSFDVEMREPSQFAHLLIAQDEAVALAERLDVRSKGQRLQLLLGEVVRRYGCPQGDVAHLNHKIRLIA